MTPQLLTWLLTAAFVVPDGLDLDDTVKMEGGIEFVGVLAPQEVPLGGKLTVEVYFKAPNPLPPDTYNFLHIESRESTCRMVQDLPPTRTDDGWIRHIVKLNVPGGPCAEAQRLEIYTGLYNRKSFARIGVVDAETSADRIYAGWLELADIDEASDMHAFTPSDAASDEVMSLVRPWWGWIWAIIAGVLITLMLSWIRRRQQREPWPLEQWTVEGKRNKRLLFWGVAAITMIPLGLSLMSALDFIKDDAYISFRYAQNVVAGNGLVFNAGEQLEGITNFMWTVLMVPFEALGLDLFQVCEVLGTGLAIGLIIYMTRISILVGGRTKDLSHLWAAVWIGTSSSVALWTTSGMEQPLAMFLPVASAFLLWRAIEEDTDKGALWSGVLMGLGCLTRPEIHLIGVIVGFPLIIRAIAMRKIDKIALKWVGGVLLVTVPLHLFRYAYYGNLLPNTFYVKTGDSALVMIAGLKKLYDMFEFNNLGVLVLFVPFAFIDKRHLMAKLVMLAVSLAFMGYIVKVGADEMRWHRLYLPALPFLVTLSAIGLRTLLVAISQWVPEGRRRSAVVLIGWFAVVGAGAANFAFTYSKTNGFNGRGDLSGNFHPDMGKFVTRHERAGAVVAFQDMGSTPYHAPDIRFLDFIGLVDGTVARARYEYGLHAFLATEAQRNKPKFDAEMRDYFYERNPEWAILTTYVNDPSGAIWKRFQKNPIPRSIGSAVSHNGYQFGIYNKKFRDNYVHVRTWPRSRGYYLSLFRRKDLWKQIPREVVLDAVPEGLGGIKATFDGGLELLGSELEPTTTRKHEFFLTTWFRVPGPMAADTFFFAHVERPGFRHPYDAKPGDWMYPADRWRAGDIVEHRTLVQIPPNMGTGEYDVWFGVYERSTGTRRKITSGPDDGQSRVHLGKVTVEAMIPPFDHLIKPTRIEEQRKYPDRIIDSGRRE